MPIPQSKTELLTAIETTYGKLRKDLLEVPVALSREQSMEGHAKGTQMSPSDLLAYLIGWGELVLKWHRDKEKGIEVAFPEAEFQWNELGLLAQKFYADYATADYTDLLKKLDDTVEKLIHLIESQSNEKLYGVAWYGKYPFGRMIQLNTSSPYKNARARIRKWLKSTKAK